MHAADEPQLTPRTGLQMIGFFDVSKNWWQADLTLPLNWQSRFQPPKNGQSVDARSVPIAVEIGVGIEALAKAKTWQIGFPVFYKVGWSGSYSYASERSTSLTHLSWWDDVMLQRTTIRRLTPAFGVSLAKGSMLLQPSAQMVALYREDYRGNDCVGCKNTSAVLERTRIKGGVAVRMDAYLRADRCGGVGWFVEKAPLVITTGITFKFNTPGKNKTCTGEKP